MRPHSLANQEAVSGLLRRLRGGSAGAWAELYDQVAPSLRRFASTLLSGDTETAHDIVVEAMAEAARDLRRFDPQKASLRSWLCGIARRRVQREIRSRSRRKSVPAWAQVSFEDLPELSCEEDPAAEMAARLDAQRRISDLRSLLSDAEREVLALSCMDGCSIRDIAQALGRSEQAVHAALHRARQKARRSMIDGRLVVGSVNYTPGTTSFRPYSHWFSGTEDWLRGDETGIWTQLSPAGDEIVYHVRGRGVQTWPPMSGHIWKAKRDGSEAVNLSEEARLTGINMYPRWRPDGEMIAFVHWDEPGGEAVAPGELWVMKADGSEARQVGPKQILPALGVAWSPDGSRLLCGTVSGVHGTPLGSTELWGREVRISVGRPTDWSPDGSGIASIRRVRGETAGERGWWNQLVVTGADGSSCKVLVEQFIADAEVDGRALAEGNRGDWPAIDWKEDLLSWVGPTGPVWSPTGDKIAFLAALPFDPEGVAYTLQVDAWVYDLVTRRLTRLTDEPHRQVSLSWR